MTSLIGLILALQIFYLIINYQNESKRRSLISFFKIYKDLDGPIDSLPFDTPTDEEIRRGFATKSPLFWGNQIRLNKCLRILVIGGSNSENHIGNSYTPTLQKRIQKLSANNVIHKSSYVIPEGFSGAGPIFFFNKIYDFEKSLSLKDWPNIIILEFSITGNNDNHGAFDLDNLIHILRQKWVLNGLLPPSFLIIDLFSKSYFYDGSPLLRKYLSNFKNGVFGSPNISILNTTFNVLK